MKNILILLMVAGLVGCGDTAGYIVEAAVKDCSTHGGVQELVTDSGSRHARCNDGTYIQFLEKAKVIQHSEDNAR